MSDSPRSASNEPMSNVAFTSEVRSNQLHPPALLTASARAMKSVIDEVLSMPDHAPGFLPPTHRNEADQHQQSVIASSPVPGRTPPQQPSDQELSDACAEFETQMWMEMIETDTQMQECEHFMLLENARANGLLYDENAYFSMWVPGQGYVNEEDQHLNQHQQQPQLQQQQQQQQQQQHQLNTYSEGTSDAYQHVSPLDQATTVDHTSNGCGPAVQLPASGHTIRHQYQNGNASSSSSSHDATNGLTDLRNGDDQLVKSQLNANAKSYYPEHIRRKNGSSPQ